MGDVHILKDTGLQLLLSHLRHTDTQSVTFRKALERVGYLMTHKILSEEFTAQEIDIPTPVGPGKGIALEEKVIVVDVLRAARYMVNGATDYFDHVGIDCQVGIVDAKRGAMKDSEGRDFHTDITTFKVPDYNENDTLIVYDPMLATAGTQLAILDHLKSHATPKKTIACCLLASKYGVERLQSAFPDITIYTLAIDTDGLNGSGLNKKGYIVPGLGDAGDRSHGT